jgi:hypothetical protein
VRPPFRKLRSYGNKLGNKSAQVKDRRTHPNREDAGVTPAVCISSETVPQRRYTANPIRSDVGNKANLSTYKLERKLGY